MTVDLGAGDGLYVYRAARRDPARLYIGIDCCAEALQEVSRKAFGKPAKGGLPNALYVHAPAECLPPELDGIATEVRVSFPWGSLLAVVLGGDAAALRGVRRICAPGACLTVVTALSESRDRPELERRGAWPGPDVCAESLAPAYQAAGFDLLEVGPLPASAWPEMDSSWGRRLASGPGRTPYRFRARADQ